MGNMALVRSKIKTRIIIFKIRNLCHIDTSIALYLSGEWERLTPDALDIASFGIKVIFVFINPFSKILIYLFMRIGFFEYFCFLYLSSKFISFRVGIVSF